MIETCSTKSAAANVPVLLDAQAANPALCERSAFSYLQDGVTVDETLTFGDLAVRARRLAARMQQQARPGERVLLLHAPGLDFLLGFYGCLYAGLVAVPAVAPTNARQLPRLHAMLQDARPALLAGSAAMLQRMAALGVDGIPTLALDAPDAGAGECRTPPLGRDTLALLQYTSGSTGTPKGVMISHGNLLANAALHQAAFGMAAGDVLVSWLPPYHDFGLICGSVFPVLAGCHAVHFPAAVFLARPIRWLRLLSETRARMTGAPNFAYDLCLERIDPAACAGLDLSALEYAVNGAERIRAGTMQAFAERFAPFGLRPGAMTPAYGLAESTLLVTSNVRRGAALPPRVLGVRRDRLAAGHAEAVEDFGADAIALVSHGWVNDARHAVCVVDTDTASPCADGTVGEIWVRGPSVGQGYWQRLEDSAATFGARLADGSGPWLRTGDLGFVREGALYIAGRRKETMIFDGRNLYPQDIEASVERAGDGLRPNGCAAFSREDGVRARLVLVAEVAGRLCPDAGALAAQIAAVLAEEHELFDLEALVLVRAGHLPRTSSGKIQRARCRTLYEAGELAALARWDASTVADAEADDAPAQLAPMLALWREQFPGAALTADTQFFALGGHSLQAAQLLQAVEQRFGARLPLQTLFENPTPRALARAVLTAGAAHGRPQAPAGVVSSVPATFKQRQDWIFHCIAAAAGMPPMTVLLEWSLAHVCPDGLATALARLQRRHPALRLCLRLQDGALVQHYADPLDCPLLAQVLDWRGRGDVGAALDGLRRVQMVQPFDFSNAPLCRVVLVRADAGATVLMALDHVCGDVHWFEAIRAELPRELASLHGSDQEPQLICTPSFAYLDWEQSQLCGAVAAAHGRYWHALLEGYHCASLLADVADRQPRYESSYRAALARQLAEVGPALDPAAVGMAAGTLLNARTTVRTTARYLAPLDHAALQLLCALAAEEGVALSTLVLASLHWLLRDLADRNDTVVAFLADLGVVSAVGEPGCHLRDHLCRLPADAPPDLRGQLRWLHAQLVASNAHLAYPLARVLAERDIAFDSLGTVQLNYSSAFSTRHMPPGGARHVQGGFAALDLNFAVAPHKDGLFVDCQYACDVFEAETVEAMVKRWQALLCSLDGGMERPVGTMLAALPPFAAAKELA